MSTTAFAVLGALSLHPVRLAAEGEPAVTVPYSVLHACAILVAATERLACYDQLFRPGEQTVAAPGVPPKKSFGLYEAEHPAPPPPPESLTARVEGVGRSTSGHTTVTLEGGGVWELDEAEPLLAAGDTVKIHRAALGSFMMETPSKRKVRVRRLK